MLKPYRTKRDFRKSPEPRGGNRRTTKTRAFVIHKHDARRLHYDFRLEIAGVLVSWAVPKGPSTDPREKRLAIRTEDHPLEYGDFEGVIPKGEYGAGTVLVWDRGTYRNLRANKEKNGKTMQKSLADGLIEIYLKGQKLKGGYALKRISAGEKQRWLLIKIDDKAADARRRPTSTEPRSVKSRRSLREIATEAKNNT